MNTSYFTFLISFFIFYHFALWDTLYIAFGLFLFFFVFLFLKTLYRNNFATANMSFPLTAERKERVSDKECSPYVCSTLIALSTFLLPSPFKFFSFWVNKKCLFMSDCVFVFRCLCVFDVWCVCVFVRACVRICACVCACVTCFLVLLSLLYFPFSFSFFFFLTFCFLKSMCFSFSSSSWNGLRP